MAAMMARGNEITIIGHKETIIKEIESSVLKAYEASVDSSVGIAGRVETSNIVRAGLIHYLTGEWPESFRQSRLRPEELYR